MPLLEFTPNFPIEDEVKFGQDLITSASKILSKPSHVFTVVINKPATVLFFSGNDHDAKKPSYVFKVNSIGSFVDDGNGEIMKGFYQHFRDTLGEGVDGNILLANMGPAYYGFGGLTVKQRAALKSD
ncbi:hypothetical protein DL96DRAFT_1703693 [Flagelloscypha sp. PMI_526]|nr:hypothetical protein DL96DRAFT_1703693 [Flagelloscypha sp. PMI_526]